ncbi:MAG: hypothetical protein ACE144_10250 [Thermodesulfobacteriota bacterium]
MRKIDYELPTKIFDQSKERYLDEVTQHLIATMQVQLYNKLKEVMIAYVIEGDVATALTIHPLKDGQKENRIKSGRWRKV